MNILVTGGAGFIGSNLVIELLEKGHDVVAVDNFSSYYNPKFKHENVQNIKSKRFKMVRADITIPTQLEQIFRKRNFDKIIHLASCVGVRNSLQHPNLYVKTNIEGTLNLLTAAKEFKVTDIIFAGSSSVYGNDTPAPFRENSPCINPLNPYAMTKRAAEILLYNYHLLYDFNITVLRFFTVYGPGGRPDMSPYIFTESLLKGQSIEIFGDGNATRDFTYIKDIVNGILLSIKNPFPYEIINLGSSNPISILNFVSILEKVTGEKAILQFGHTNPAESRNTYADTSKAKKLLGFESSTSLETGLSEFVGWYLDKRFNKSKSA